MVRPEEWSPRHQAHDLLLRMLRAANRDYPDGFLEEYFDERGRERPGGSGDTLALFIVREVRELFDPDESAEDNIARVVKALMQAESDLAAARIGLEDLMEDIGREEGR